MAKAQKKPKETKGPKYEHAPDYVAEMAARLIENYHSHLAEARIRYLFKNDKWTKKGKTVFGQAKLASEETRLVGEYDFVIIINSQIWHSLDEKRKQAVLDHELTHCACETDKEGNKKWTIADHDFNDFNSIVRRYGMWHDDLSKLKIAIAMEEDKDI